MMRLYAPAIVLIFWSLLLAVTHCDGMIFAVATVVSLVAAVVVQGHETRRRRHG